MKHIKFVTWFGPYQAGQWATFPANEAARLVAAGKAVWHDTEATAAPPKRSSTTSKMVSK